MALSHFVSEGADGAQGLAGHALPRESALGCLIQCFIGDNPALATGVGIELLDVVVDIAVHRR